MITVINFTKYVFLGLFIIQIVLYGSQYKGWDQVPRYVSEVDFTEDKV